MKHGSEESFVAVFEKGEPLFFGSEYQKAIGILQCIPEISISNGYPVIFIPFAIIVILSAIKDIWEDNKRKKADKAENNKEIKIWNGARFESKKWKEIRVGNIVLVFSNSIKVENES